MGFEVPPGDWQQVLDHARQFADHAGKYQSFESDAHAAFASTLQTWLGPRATTFRAAGQTLELTLSTLAEHTATAHQALLDYAVVLRRAQEDIPQLQHQAVQRQEETARNLRAVALDGPAAHSAATQAAEQHCATFVNGLQRQADELRDDVHRAATKAAMAIDAATSCLCPGAGNLSPGQVGRLVEDSSGLSAAWSGYQTHTLTVDQAFTALLGSTTTAVTPYLEGTPLPSDPTQMAALWNRLTPADKEALFQKYPDLGNYDGIPCTDRDLFNQAGLDGQIAELEKARDAILAKYHGQPPPATIDQVTENPDFHRYEQLFGLLEGSYTLKVSLSNPDFMLLAYKPHQGYGQAIISQGNPDTATNVVTFVPGTGTKLANIWQGIQRSSWMHREAQWCGAKSVAAVTWYGYKAPPSLLQALNHGYAHDASAPLDNFQTGLRLTHQGPPAYTTVMGHSYGATVVTDAASRAHHLAANDATLVAPAGAGDAVHASDLHLQRYNGQEPIVYATAAENDWIPTLASIPHDYLTSKGFPQSTADGPNATTPDFHAHMFTSAPGEWYDPFAAHGEYWDVSSPSLRSIGEIVAGNRKGVH